METNSYIFANVRIPLRLNEDDTIETLNDYIRIDFDVCDNLPEKNIQPINQNIISRIKELLNGERGKNLEELDKSDENQEITRSSDEKREITDKIENKITISLNELINKTTRKPSQNTTFKKYKNRHLRNTMRVNP